jgi:hypothetical protein
MLPPKLRDIEVRGFADEVLLLGNFSADSKNDLVKGWGFSNRNSGDFYTGRDNTRIQPTKETLHARDLMGFQIHGMGAVCGCFNR